MSSVCSDLFNSHHADFAVPPDMADVGDVVPALDIAIDDLSLDAMLDGIDPDSIGDDLFRALDAGLIEDPVPPTESLESGLDIDLMCDAMDSVLLGAIADATTYNADAVGNDGQPCRPHGVGRGGYRHGVRGGKRNLDRASPPGPPQSGGVTCNLFTSGHPTYIPDKGDMYCGDTLAKMFPSWCLWI